MVTGIKCSVWEDDMKFRHMAFVVAGLLATVSQSAAAEWLEAKTKHFKVYGDVSEKEMIKFVDRMERFDGALRSLIQPKEVVPVTIYLVDGVSEVQRLAKGGGMAAYYLPRYDGPIAVAPTRLTESGSMSAQSMLLHEYAHHLLISNTDQYYPGWMNEGFAEFFMTAKFSDDGSVTFGAPNNDRDYWMTQMSRWSAKELLESDKRKLDALEVGQKYSRGWLMVHYLLLGGERDGQLAQYVGLINNGMKPVEAGEKVFGDLKKLNSDLELYMRRSQIKTITLAPKDFSFDSNIVLRRLTPGEAAIMPTRMYSTTGVDAQMAKKTVAKASPIAANFLNDSFVQASYAEMQYDNKDYAGADTSLNRALAINPKNFDAIIYKGRVAAMKAVQSKNADDWKTARKWFLQANKQEPDNPLPFVLYYDSFGAEGKTAPESAVDGLLRALVLVPQDVSVRARTAVALVNVGDLKTARSVLAATAGNAHLRVDNPYRKLLDAIDDTQSKEAALKVIDETKLNKMNEFVQPPKEDKKD